jgi:hypothetical protein
METTENVLLKTENLFQKLLRIQTHIESFVKNKQAFNYSYVDGNQVLGEIRPLMNSAGLLLKQECLSVKNERYDYVTTKGISKTEVLSTLEMKFTWVDCVTGEKDENLFCANGMNDFDKGVGSALTYGERYFLLKYFHIPTDQDDVDNLKRDVGTVSKKFDNNLPWLNKNTKEFDGAVKKLKEGTTTIEKIRTVMKVSKEVEKLLNDAIKPVANAKV